MNNQEEITFEEIDSLFNERKMRELSLEDLQTIIQNFELRRTFYADVFDVVHLKSDGITLLHKNETHGYKFDFKNTKCFLYREGDKTYLKFRALFNLTEDLLTLTVCNKPQISLKRLKELGFDL